MTVRSLSLMVPRSTWAGMRLGLDRGPPTCLDGGVDGPKVALASSFPAREVHPNRI